MRLMAGDASLGFYRRVLKNERAGLVSVAIEADLVLRCRRAKLTGKEAAMRVMAITACDQALIDPMVHGFYKIGFNFKMAAVAELRLRCL